MMTLLFNRIVIYAAAGVIVGYILSTIINGVLS